MKQQVIILDKPIGKTPLQMVELFKERNPEYKEDIISYAGRLDPMAHGLLILLIGDENKQRESYLHLDKTYEVEILFGVETDTYDVLGKIQSCKETKLQRSNIENKLQTFIGKREQVYPPYSSKAVQGKPLFWWAREGKLGEIEIPKREIEIFSIDYVSEKEIGGKELLTEIKKRIGEVQGDFRQAETLSEWKTNSTTTQVYAVIKIQVTCSSGTYMRTLAHELGKQLGTSAIAFDIKRTQVGKYLIKDVQKI